MTDFEKESLKTELEMYSKILVDTYLESSKRLEEARKDSSPDAIHKFERHLHTQSRKFSKLYGFCKAMEIIDGHLGLGLEIPEEGKLIKP